MALLCAKLGEHQEVIRYWNQAVEKVPLPNVMVLYNKSCIMLVYNRIEDSLNLLRELTNLDPTYKNKAKNDPDFKKVKDDPRFKEIVGSSI